MTNLTTSVTSDREALRYLEAINTIFGKKIEDADNQHSGASTTINITMKELEAIRYAINAIKQ